MGTPTTCSVYGGNSVEISSNETKAARLIRNSLNSNGEAPGLRLICFVTRAFEQLLSAGSIVVTLSRTPYVSAKDRSPVSPHSYPWVTILLGSNRKRRL